MSPKRRAAILVGTAFALTLPFVAFVLYFSLRLPQNNWPAWFTNTLAGWFVANFLVIFLVARSLSKKMAPETQDSRLAPAKLRANSHITRMKTSYLVILWSAFFLYGVKGTIQGKYPLNRAIPAGAFLLFFIAVFGWSLYRSFQEKP